MKLKKLVSTFLAVAMVATILVGCTTPTGQGGEPTAAPTAKPDSGSTASTSFDKTISIEMYNVAANYQGVQSGWFAKVLKDSVNIELNIIAPQVAGDAIYQTRASAGNLGDLVLLERSDFADCVKTGLVREITNELKNTKNLPQYMDQINVFNTSLEGNTAGKIYGIPVEMTNTGPTAYSQDVIYSSPMLRWDLYKELGMPEIKDLDGLLDVLEAMKNAHPTNADGDPAYPFSLWADWDGGDGMMGIANVVQLTTWYGEKIKGSVITKPDYTYTPLTDKSATYYKITNFLNKAFRKGLVDPDSGTQNWDAACAKMSSGQVYLLWYSWQVGFWNSTDRLKDGNAFIFVPVKDQYYYADSDTYYGSGRILGVGSKVDEEKYQRIMAFLDWYAGPESLEFQHNGIKDFNYEVKEDGRYYVKLSNALMDNLPTPEEWGGGGYQDGFNAFNQWIVASISTNPKTGEPYASQYWSTYKEEMMTQMKREWAEKFGAAEPVEYMKKNNVLFVSPNVSITLPSDPSDISVIRNQCESVLEDFTWRMIFAKDQAEFDSMWDEMSSQMDGLGFQQLVEYDKQKHQPELDAKKAAAASAN
jgi:putative aldouronate transport system substrate-binding protein